MKKIFVTATLVKDKKASVERRTVVNGPVSEATQVVTRVLHVARATKIH